MPSDVFDDVVVRDDFLAPDVVVDLAGCADLRRARGEFRAAAIGKTRARRPDIRGDSTCWLQEPLLPAERVLLDTLETLRAEWNQRTYLGLFDLEAHYACYPPGARYERHVDQVRGGAPRILSFVLYLNATWPLDAGGELRIHSTTGTHRDLLPLGGRLVCFMAAEHEHEVLPARRVRLSVCGWFRGRG